jgi:hypothetical protein
MTNYPMKCDFTNSKIEIAVRQSPETSVLANNEGRDRRKAASADKSLKLQRSWNRQIDSFGALELSF